MAYILKINLRDISMSEILQSSIWFWAWNPKQAKKDLLFLYQKREHWIDKVKTLDVEQTEVVKLPRECVPMWINVTLRLYEETAITQTAKNSRGSQTGESRLSRKQLEMCRNVLFLLFSYFQFFGEGLLVAIVSGESGIQTILQCSFYPVIKYFLPKMPSEKYWTKQI